MIMTVSELKPEEFNEALLPIFHGVRDGYKLRAGFETPGEFAPDLFIRQWRSLMTTGLARTWSVPGAVLGAIFTPSMFTGDKTAVVVFWDAEKGCSRSRELLSFCERAAREAGCVSVQASALNNSRSRVMKRFYRMAGFNESETIFLKAL